MKKKHLLLVIYGALHTLVCIAQGNQKIDSLINVLDKQKDDTGRINTLIILGKEFLMAEKISEAKKYTADALSLAEKKGYEKGISGAKRVFANIYFLQGNIYYHQGNYPEALKNYFASLKLFETTGVSSGIANIRRNIGLVYQSQGNYSEALKNHLISLEIFKKINEQHSIASVYNGMGIIYKQQGNYPEALKNYLAAIKIYEETGDKEPMINQFFNIGFLYDDQGNYSEALKNYLSALKISKETENQSGIAASYSNIGDIYFQRGKARSYPKQKDSLFNEALKNYLFAVKKFEEAEDKEGLAVCYNGIGAVYIELKNYAKAKQFLTNGLFIFKEAGTIEYPDEFYRVPADYIKDNYELLVRLDSASGNWKGAFSNHKLYVLYRDSLVNQENTEKIMKSQMQYDFDKKEDSLKYEQQLSEEKLKEQTLLTKQQKLLKNYLLAGLALFIILSFFVYWNYRTRQQLKLQKLRNKIAIDLHDDVGSTLSSISIFSEMAKQQSKEVIPLLETIGESSRKMLDAMADIVWSINPENDQFEKIILRMRSFAYELLGAKNIDFEFIADDYVTKVNVPMNVRKNLYLIFKEATNNLAKYAGTDRALFSLTGEKNNLTMLIKDNGKGFDTGKATDGNGLKNMKKRADEMGAQLVIDSYPGNGTTIQLRVEV